MFLFFAFPKIILGKRDEFWNEYSEDFKTLLHVQEGQKNISIPSQVTLIFGESTGNNAFIDCQGIKEIYFAPDSNLETIGPYALYRCLSLKKINLLNCKKLKKIDTEGMRDCNGLVELQLPSSVTELGFQCFRWIRMTEFTIGKSVTVLKGNVFFDCQSLKRVIFEDGSPITVIPDNLFEGSAIEYVKFPPVVNSLGKNVFYRTVHLKEVEFQTLNACTFINGVFCTNEKNKTIICIENYTTDVITVPDTITVIDEYSFSYCQAKEIVVGTSVTAVKYLAFDSSSVQKIHLPDSVTDLRMNAFQFCRQLTDIRLPSNITKIQTSLFYYCESLETITIPDSVTKIEFDAFSFCKNLKTINLPSNLKELQQTCFKGCENLGKVVLPKDLAKFGGGAFSGCYSINLSFAEGSRFNIDEQFLITTDNCTLLCQYIGFKDNFTINIPDTVTTIDASAFSLVENQIYLEFSPESQLKIIRKDAFSRCKITNPIEFPNSLEKIESCAFQFSTIPYISFGENINSIESSAFANTPIKNVTFSAKASNLSIHSFAFADCANLDSVIFPEYIDYIGSYAFNNARLLTEIVFPPTLKRIGDHIFWGTGVKNITFSNTPVLLDEISDNAFDGATKLREFQFAEGIGVIGQNAFYNTALYNVTLPSTVRCLKKGCFSHSPNLITINIGDSNSQLEEIQESIFENCLNLQKIECTAKNFIIYNGGLYNSNRNKIYAFPPASNIHMVPLPPELVEILPSTFYSCKNVNYITIMDISHLNGIGPKAFYNCANLKFINIPNSVQDIGFEAFQGCISLNCGLIIEKDSPEFHEKLLNAGKIPKHCLKPCPEDPKLECKYSVRSLTLCIGIPLIINAE